MDWREAARGWNTLGRRNPFGSILTENRRLARGWDVDRFFATGRADVEALMPRIIELVPMLKRRAALDFGCGVGRITRALSDHFDAVLGIDAADSMITLAHKLNRDRPRCQFRLNRSNQLEDIESDRFDFVYSRLVLQHIPPDAARGYIVELVRVLAPGGVLLFQLPGIIDVDPEEAYVEAPVADTFLKRRLARGIVRAWRRIKFRVISDERRSGGMYMFGLPQEDVVALLGSCGATLLCIRDDRSHGTDAPGYEYWVMKRQGNALSARAEGSPVRSHHG